MWKSQIENIGGAGWEEGEEGGEGEKGKDVGEEIRKKKVRRKEDADQNHPNHRICT